MADTAPYQSEESIREFGAVEVPRVFNADGERMTVYRYAGLDYAFQSDDSLDPLLMEVVAADVLENKDSRYVGVPAPRVDASLSAQKRPA